MKGNLFTAALALAIAFTLGCEEKSSGKSISSTDEDLSSSATVSPAAEAEVAPPLKEEAGGDTQGGCPNAVTGSGTLSCGGQTYKTIKIGTQTWMAENLNYNADGSKCYEDDESNCQKYGRLYNLATAVNACPKGWHLPSVDEWNVLMASVGGEETAGKYLKAKSGWNDYEGKSGNGEDKFGFAALPGGFSTPGGSFSYVGNGGLWWIDSEDDSDYAPTAGMYYNHENVVYNNDGRNYFFSVRCVKD